MQIMLITMQILLNWVRSGMSRIAPCSGCFTPTLPQDRIPGCAVYIDLPSCFPYNTRIQVMENKFEWQGVYPL